MMTPQEVASSTFPKATIGGYNMAAVDVFLDKLTEDYTDLYKENSALKAKIKVVVDKMEEYHAMEDTMRATLLTAQKMASDMVNEAERKSAALVSEGEDAARRRIMELRDEIAAEELRLETVRAEIDSKIEEEHKRLAAAQDELNAFIRDYRKLCEKQLNFIERLPELKFLPKGFTLSEPAEPERSAVPNQEAAVAEPEIPSPVPAAAEVPAEDVVDDAVAAAALAEVVEELGGDATSLMQSMRDVIDSFSHEESGTPAEEKPVEDIPFEIGFEDAESLFDEKSAPVEEDPFVHDDDEEGATRVINLDDLQFGRNYTKE